MRLHTGSRRHFLRFLNGRYFMYALLNGPGNKVGNLALTTKKAQGTPRQIQHQGEWEWQL